MSVTIRDIPTSMRANGWSVGARRMDRWFAHSARVMSPAEKQGDVVSPDMELRIAGVD
jgi:hypothetical protein